MIELHRYWPGNPLPETGVLFPFFESVSAAIWWVEHMTEFHSTNLSDVTRKDLLKQFLFTDAMARLLRLFIRESREADQEIGNRMLAQSAALTQTKPENAQNASCRNLSSQSFFANSARPQLPKSRTAI